MYNLNQPSVGKTSHILCHCAVILSQVNVHTQSESWGMHFITTFAMTPTDYNTPDDLCAIPANCCVKLKDRAV